MSHDSASGEIIEARDHILAAWTKTQSQGLVSQLNCGARAFDYRPYYDSKDGHLYAHHGGVKIHKPMKESLLAILNWTRANPLDLVVLYLSHFDGNGGDPEAETLNLLDSLGIYTLTDTNCNITNTIEYDEVKTKSTLKTGGHLVAVVNCMDELYDSTINCYEKDFVCYNSTTSAIPWKNMISYTSSVSSKTSSHSSLWMNQAHWQSTVATVVLGTLHRSSIVLDESRSGVNAWAAAQVQKDAWYQINFLELDNVCDGGLDVYRAIRNTYMQSRGIVN